MLRLIHRSLAWLCVVLPSIVFVAMSWSSNPASRATIGETPVITQHLDHQDIVDGVYRFKRLFRLGRELFVAKFNFLDGQGRPAATGDGNPTHRDPANDPGFLRTSATDSNSCAGCHNEPRAGGSGDFVANVFVLAQVLDPVTFDVRDADERNTLGMFGSGAIELLGREMTRDLISIRKDALEQAAASGGNVTLDLVTKGVRFGQITARPDGTVDTSGVQGVDADLIIKPFHQKGVVRSIREFTVNAMNHHHGMEAIERFGMEQTGTRDFDQDGVEDELTVGDITAVTIFQAALAVPVQALPSDPDRRAAVRKGRKLFRQAGCTSCHRPSLELESSVFCEPYELNPSGTFSDTSEAYCFDLTKQGETPLLQPNRRGKLKVRAFTDLKRHVISDAAHPHFTENLVQAGVPTNQMLTRKLWDVGSSAPYGHRGDLTTISEAILSHGGEANASRSRFEALTETEQAQIVEFLKSLRVLEDPSLVDLAR